MKAITTQNRQKIIIFVILACVVLTPILSLLFFAFTGSLEDTIREASTK